MRKLKFNTNHLQQLYALMHQGVMAVYGFGILFLLIRLLPTNEVGRWLIFSSAISLCDMLMHGLLQTIVVKETTTNQQNPLAMKQLQFNVLLLSSLVVILLSILLIVAHGSFSIFSKDIVALNDLSKWYPAFGAAMLMYNLSWWLNMGKQNYRVILTQRLIYVFISILILFVYYQLHHSISFSVAVLSQLIGYAIASVFSFFANHFCLNYQYFSRNKINYFLQYGKYNVGTLLGSSLLRNADIFMIAIWMNSAAVAVYSLAQKMIEIFEVILRPVAATSLPLFHKLHQDTQAFTAILIKRIVFLSLLFIPANILLFCFADSLIGLMSRSGDYHLSVIILRVFILYILLLPIDRLLGVALEACNKPALNLIKTLVLIVVNVTGNFIALYFLKSLPAVAAVSSIALSIGIGLGFYFLKDHLQSRNDTAIALKTWSLMNPVKK